MQDKDDPRKAMGVTAYFDGSRTDRFLTLACIACTDDAWVELSTAWLQMRDDLQGNASHESLHMTDLVAKQGAFKGWENPKVNWVANFYFNVLGAYNNDPRVKAWTCTIDLTAHALRKEEKSLPEPERICTRILLGAVMKWFMDWDNRLPSPLHLVFDRGEQFMRHVREDWENTDYKRRYSWMQAIASIELAVSSVTPALQMVDMIAWGTIRRAKHPWGHEGIRDPLALQAERVLPPNAYRIYDEELRTQRFDEEGYRAMNPQRREQQERSFLRKAIIRP